MGFRKVNSRGTEDFIYLFVCLSLNRKPVVLGIELFIKLLTEH